MESIVINGVNVDLIAKIIKLLNRSNLNIENLLSRFDIISLSKLKDYLINAVNQEDYLYLESIISNIIIELYDKVYYLIDEDEYEYVENVNTWVDEIINAGNYEEIYSIIEDLSKRDITFIIKLLILKGDTFNYAYLLKANEENSASLYKEFKLYVELDEIEIETKKVIEDSFDLIDVMDISSTFNMDSEFCDDKEYIKALNHLYKIVINESVYEPQILKLLEDYNNRYILNSKNKKIRILY